MLLRRHEINLYDSYFQLGIAIDGYGNFFQVSDSISRPQLKEVSGGDLLF
jgi:hypothetical protein